MINLRITDNSEDVLEWTGLPRDNYDEALWDAAFNLDDWDICIESDIRLFKRVSDGRGNWWDEPLDEAWWLVYRMSGHPYRYNEVEYNGKWYYTVYHT